jgi:uncharacterized protein with PIN domain
LVEFKAKEKNNMMDVNELEVEIKKGKEALAALEVLYEKEEDEGKASKLEYSISRKDESIDKLIERQQILLDREAKDAEKPEPKDKNKEEEDKDVCPECGGDLVLVGKDDTGETDVYECETCGELFLDE